MAVKIQFLKMSAAMETKTPHKVPKNNAYLKVLLWKGKK
jgi:hypothetical protein